jgi:hypothetical protein
MSSSSVEVCYKELPRQDGVLTFGNDEVFIVYFIFDVFNAELCEHSLQTVLTCSYIRCSGGQNLFRTGYPHCYDENDVERECHLHPSGYG